MNLRRSAVALTAVSLALAIAGPAAAATPPSNDTSAGATVLASVPTTVTEDVSAATTDAEDTALNQFCGAPATNSSVWFSYTAQPADQGLIIDVSGSTVSSGVIVSELAPDGTSWVDTCGPGTVGVPVVPGTTYRILAFSDQPSVSGHTLVLDVKQAKIPTVSATVNPKGKVDRYGNALISGTFTCTDADFVGLDTTVVQSVGRFSIQGDGFTADSACDGAAHAWTATVTPYNGKFAGGKAATFTWAFSCGQFFCSDSYSQAKVQLSK